jgi:hypothetical protein
VGIVVKDIEKAAELFGALLDFKRKVNIVEQSSDINYKGQDGTVRMKKIMQNWGDKQLEIVEVVDATGPNVYSDAVKAGQFGLHHLGTYVDNADELVKYFKDNYDIDIIQSGKAGPVNFYYLDTEQTLGFILELINIKKKKRVKKNE